MNSSIWGKLIGGFLGALVAGPFGLIIGIFLGHLVDKNLQSPFKKPQQAEAQQVFFEVTFLVMGHIAKADGRISEAEIRAARKAMGRLGLNEAQKLRAINLFTQGKQPGFHLQQTLQRLSRACGNNRILLRMFIEIQTQAAMADGGLPYAKQQALQTICQYLGFPPVNFGFFNDWFGTQRSAYEKAYQHAQQQTYNYRQHHQQYNYQQRSRTNHGVSSLDEAYAILGVNHNASNAEIKRAYRRLMSQHHPDKLIAKGLPEEMLKVATEKTQKIKAAYESVCAARGVN